MLKYLFARIWKNPIARYGSIAGILLISFAVIFSARFGLLKTLSRMFSSPDWSDTLRHGSKPFAFAENEDKARALIEQGWKALHELAATSIDKNQSAAETLTAAVTRKPYSSFLRRESETVIFTYLNGLKSGCGDYRTSVEITDRTTALGELAASRTVAARIAQHQTEGLKKTLEIFVKYVEPAMQKKPDFVPAIELAEEIYRATCALRETAPLWARALDYREYALQKQMYDSDNGRLYDKDPELFETKFREKRQQDNIYRELLVRHFDATRFRTPYDPAQLKNVRNAYFTLKSPAALTAMIAALLAEARHSSSSIARKCHYELFSLDDAGITDREDYLYALAETAVRGEEFVRAQNVISNALKAKTLRDPATRRDLERLRFHLELLRNESESLSRF
ncbi:hypothetical protein [Turneriella parva]|uniref:Uncharacterized protein n=1 Tax=Turneriella parva (strain ATCC BAA-1111 / DSM 21527 / NCTC 11395 / H) TaxID=869212 RepID=I4B0N5_TURPD|nr:hypothetical protein [Turneriella parva]AFM10842.1 hypothetical protein Turpa_0180 [Turneriella parva DSM 21527]